MEVYKWGFMQTQGNIYLGCFWWPSMGWICLVRGKVRKWLQPHGGRRKDRDRSDMVKWEKRRETQTEGVEGWRKIKLKVNRWILESWGKWTWMGVSLKSKNTEKWCNFFIEKYSQRKEKLKTLNYWIMKNSPPLKRQI